MYIGLSEYGNSKAFLANIRENLWRENMQIQAATIQLIASATPGKKIEPLWVARSLVNKLRVHVNHVGNQRPGKTKTWYLQDSLKFLSFIEVTVHPQICCFWCRWVDLANLYNCSLLIFLEHLDKCLQIRMEYNREQFCPPCHFGVKSGRADRIVDEKYTDEWVHCVGTWHLNS